MMSAPPLGPHGLYMPRHADLLSAAGGDNLGDNFHPVPAAHVDINRYRVHNSTFELRPTHIGNWPALCTFEVDDGGNLHLVTTEQGFKGQKQ
jgi:hypothetical protein